MITYICVAYYKLAILVLIKKSNKLHSIEINNLLLRLIAIQITIKI